MTKPVAVVIATLVLVLSTSAKPHFGGPSSERNNIPCEDVKEPSLCDLVKRWDKCGDNFLGLFLCKKTCDRCSECKNWNDAACGIFGRLPCEHFGLYKNFKCPVTCQTCTET